MSDLSQRDQAWENRAGLIEVGTLPIVSAVGAITRSLGTSRHARRLVESIEAELGDRALADPSAPEASRWVFLRSIDDSSFVIAKPIVKLTLGRTSVVVAKARIGGPRGSVDEPADPDPKPTRLAPVGGDLVACELRFNEGLAFLELVYDERGQFRETSQSSADPWIFARYARERPYTVDPLARPPTQAPLSLLCRSDLSTDGHREDALAHMVIASIRDQSSVARVRMPKPIPGGIEVASSIGLAGIRRALFANMAGEMDRYAVADGFDGSAFATGRTVEEAIERWEAELFRAKPRPPGEAPPVPGEDVPHDPPRVHQDEEGRMTGFSTGTLVIRGTGASGIHHWPTAIPANIPAVLIDLGALPEKIPASFWEAGFRRWLRVVGEVGHVRHMLLREARNGVTCIGEAVLDLVDVWKLDEELDAADRVQRDMLRAIPDAESFSASGASYNVYRLFDNGPRKRIPCELSGGTTGQSVTPSSVVRDDLAWSVSRFRAAP